MTSLDESLTIVERIRVAVQLGESHFREFKSAHSGPPHEKVPRDRRDICRDIAEALVAFANADGGELLLGVEDDGTVTGIPHKAELTDSFVDAWKTHVHNETPLPAPRLSDAMVDGHRVMYFSTEKGTASIYLTSDGRCLQRRDRETVPVSSEQIRFERQERISREFDRQYVDGGDSGVLDVTVVERIAQDIAPGLSAEKVLQLLDLADFDGGAVRLRRAAVLLLAGNVSRWHPRCQVRILRVDGQELKAGRDYNVTRDVVVEGSILDLLSRAWEEVRPYLVETRLDPDGRFQEQVRYPEDACREALTNAIAHRDYAMEGRGIEIYVFDDRLEVHSPGALLSNVSLDGIKRLKGVHQSRNATVARTLRELGYMREMGEGFRRIFQLMQAHDLVAPEISADAESFVVALRHQSVFSEDDQRWIAAYDQFELARDEQKVLLLGRAEEKLSVDQIMSALDLVDTEDYRALIERLQQKGLLIGIPASKSGRSGGRKRSAPRWRVMQPKEANTYYSELVRGVQHVYHGRTLERQDFQQIGSFISVGSPYAADRVAFSLRRLAMIDSAGNPIGRMRAVLDSQPTPLENGPSRERGARSSTEVRRNPKRAEEPESSDAALAEQEVHVFVGNLEGSITRADLEALFMPFEASRVSVPRDYQGTKANRGYGFVVFPSLLLAEGCMTRFRGTELRGRSLLLEWARQST